MPLLASSPAAAASWLLGVIPTPAMTPSASIRLRRPAALVGPAPAAGDLGDLDTAAQVHAVLLVQGGEDLGGLAAEHPQQRQFRLSSTVTARPAARAAAAVSRPIQPAPITATREEDWRAALIRSLSPTFRR